MKYEYKKEIVLPYSEIDSSAKISLISVLNYIQDMSTEYFETIGTDNFAVKNNNNALWVITKTKVKFYERPVWKDKIFIRIYAVKLSDIRFDVEIAFENENKETLIIAKQEYCAMDIESRKVRKIATISFPSDLEIEEEKYQDEYKRLRDEFENEEIAYIGRVFSQDIDFSKHTNNVVYVRFLMNLFSCHFWENNEIQDFEIHYLSESREGQDLEIYKRNRAEKEIEFLIKESGKFITRAYMTLK